jgi:hypothetical protein
MVPARRRFVPVAKGGRPVEKMDYELSPPGFSRENMAKSLEFQGLMQLTGVGNSLKNQRLSEHTRHLIHHRWTKPVRPWRALEKAELDQQPDRSDDWDKADEHPPAGFVAVVKAFDIDDDGRDQRDQREDAAEKSHAQLGIVVSRLHVYESQQKDDRGQRQDKPEPKLLAVYSAFRREIELLEIHGPPFPHDSRSRKHYSQK